MDYIITALISYLFGSIPFGYIFTKIFLKKDIRDVGSGNIGATNVLKSPISFSFKDKLLIETPQLKLTLFFLSLIISTELADEICDI